ncbi:hypothetical protein VFPPC_14486 [Pochonia chlamydosporia 170]|uniref:Uncharacterized protein n=1 Tax=Pochonia chlamydosporia 170 TaxID=1380566 RepID=A0A179FCU0_METCM|nr:hypothetical protein VFPPC_14486 [Pochonia chlamydosporia 170]OAQ62873.1 hypothetical protein VFPPC_14486 [Pochonia chlamydosporia 170]
MATVSSEEDFMDDILSFSRATSHAAAVDLCGDNAPLGHRLLERTGSDLSYTGSWTDEDSNSTSDHSLEIDNWTCSRPPKVPRAPDLGRLTTPHLSPMPSMFEFCYCCSDDEKEPWENDRINDSLRLSRRDKVDAQLDWAMAYMEQRRRGV